MGRISALMDKPKVVVRKIKGCGKKTLTQRPITNEVPINGFLLLILSMIVRVMHRKEIGDKHMT